MLIAAVVTAITTSCACGVVPERQNDFFWENEIFGMRAYGPGEFHKWSGLDVFNKMPKAGSVGDLLAGKIECGNWHKEPAAGILDNYTMGASRGCGAVAVFGDGEWKTYPDWETCEIITNTPYMVDFKLVYPAFCAAGRMTYRITLRKGEQFFRNEVSFEKGFKGALAGPALDINPGRGHGGRILEDGINGIVALYEDDKGGVEGSTMTAIFMDPTEDHGVTLMTDHLGCRVIALNKFSTNFVYYAGARWSRRGGIMDAAGWFNRVTESREKIKALKAAPALGLWWWDKKLVSDAALDYAKEHGITEIYFCTDLFGDETADFISRANARGMKVYWLTGDPSWVNDWSGIEKEIATKILPFQTAHPRAKFAGIHLDVEPHGLPEFKDDRKGLFRKLVAMAKALREKFPKEHFTYDLPFWAEDEIEFGGAVKPVFAHVMDYSDRTVYMTYRDTAAAVIDTGRAEMEYAAKHGKSVFVAVETTSDEAPTVSFKEEGRAVMDKVLKELREQLPDSVGIAIHHMNSWMNFK